MSKLTRIDFLKKVFGAGMLLSIPPLGILVKKQKDLYSWTGSAIPVFMYESYIRGYQYYEGPEVIGSMKAGDELDLVREPDNKYDGYATAIYWNARKLGYLPREENITMANLLDQGMLLNCMVKRVFKKNASWESILVTVRLLVPENENFKEYLKVQQNKK